MAAHYGKRAYWDERYSRDPEPFDWYQRYDGIKKFLALEYLEGSLHQSSDLSPLANDGCSPCPHLVDSKKLTRFPSKDSCRVLIIGCGTSRLGEDMLMDGWNGGIHQIDYSAVVIKHMTARYDDNFYKKIEASMNYRNSDSEKSEVSHDSVKVKDHEMIKNMCFQCLDITKTLPFENSFFDLIICKGTLDAILCSDGATANARLMMEECARLLNEHGVLVCVSHASPENRMMYFENDIDPWWKGGVCVHTIPKPKLGSPMDDQMERSRDHFIYIASKSSLHDNLDQPQLVESTSSSSSDGF